MLNELLTRPIDESLVEFIEKENEDLPTTFKRLAPSEKIRFLAQEKAKLRGMLYMAWQEEYDIWDFPLWLDELPLDTFGYVVFDDEPPYRATQIPPPGKFRGVEMPKSLDMYFFMKLTLEVFEVLEAEGEDGFGICSRCGTYYVLDEAHEVLCHGCSSQDQKKRSPRKGAQ